MNGIFTCALQEIQEILKHVMKRNNIREEIMAKKQAFEAWRQVTEVILTACPNDLLDGEKRQSVLFEIIQELLKKVRVLDFVYANNVFINSADVLDSCRYIAE